MTRWLWVLALILTLLSTAFRPRLMQGGCDSPAHLLLTETFDRNQSSIGSQGLRAEINDELLQKGFNPAQISRAISPICIHWDGQHQFNQYPPYLAFLLRALPLKFRALGFGTLVFFLFVGAALVIAHHADRRYRREILGAILLLLVTPILYPELRSIFGLPVSFAVLLVVPTLLLNKKHPFWLGALLGFASGVRYDVAIPALLIGFFGFLQHPQRWRWALSFGTAYIVTAIIPLGLYQNLVLGNWRKPVTPTYDLAFVDSFYLFAKNLWTYLVTGWSMWGLALLGFLFRPTSRFEKSLKGFFAGTCIFGLCFVAAKKVQMSYYFWPWAAFGFSLLLIELSRRSFGPQFRKVSLLALIAFGGVQSIKGFKRVQEDFRVFALWQKNLPASFPKDLAWVEGNVWSSNIDTFRVHENLSLLPVVRNDTDTPPAIQNAIDAYLDLRKIPVYHLQNLEGDLKCSRNCP